MKFNVFLKPAFYFLTLLSGALMCSAFVSNRTHGSEEELDALLAKMTIEEKIGQMTQLNLDVVCVGEIYKLQEPHRLDMTKLRNALVKWQVGSILNCGGHAYPRKQWLEIIGGIQEVATTETRLKIPILYGIDAIHGANYVSNATLFPQQLAQAASFNPELTRQATAITAYETRAVGIPWNFSPVLDVARNPLWSRFFETYGEDALMCSRFGEAAILGYQGKSSAAALDALHVAACMKHFLGYGGMRSGKDRTPAYISDIQLREIYLPSFMKAIQTGALTLMINSGEINGEPVHASKKILTGLLRDELKFEGVAVTDWEDIMKLQLNHRVAATLKEATLQAVDAGIDMCMVPNDFEFPRLLLELVKEGKVSEARLDLSVKRILKLKQKLGILKKANLPALSDYPLFGSQQHTDLARMAASESITLLENRHQTLPFKSQQRILVTGPAAHSMSPLNGAWTRTWQGVDTTFDDRSKNTIYEALINASPGKITYAQGCSVDSMTNLNRVLELSRASDVIVACVGENPSTEKPGDINDLELSPTQQQFVKELLKTGKPVVLVLVENRPRIVREIATACSAVVMAYQPGDFGGDALADILYGKVNPSGRLPFTYPQFNHGLIWYDHKYTETFDSKYGNNAFQPQWPFGHGLSYSEVRYADLKISSNTLHPGEKLTISIQLTNASDREVKEPVLLFARDHFASITPSVRQLKDFTKITLAPNSSQTVSFTLDESQLSFIGKEAKPVLEEGDFDVMIGALKSTFKYLLK
jgi:beta-glucosidase